MEILVTVVLVALAAIGLAVLALLGLPFIVVGLVLVLVAALFAVALAIPAMLLLVIVPWAAAMVIFAWMAVRFGRERAITVLPLLLAAMGAFLLWGSFLHGSLLAAVLGGLVLLAGGVIFRRREALLRGLEIQSEGGRISISYDSSRR